MAIDRTAIITGAGSPRGIGRAVAARLAMDGFALALLDLDEAGARTGAAELSDSHGVTTLGLHCDVTDPASVDATVTQVDDELPPVAALVNCAGIVAPTAFVDIALTEWDRIFEVNVRGMFIVTQRVLPRLIDQGYGRIVNLSSASGQRGGGVFGGAHYSASKAAVLGLTRALAREVGRHSITVNAIAPGLIDTDMSAVIAEEARARLLENIPLHRSGSPDDVAQTVGFLCSPGAGYITGATLDVNGGSHIH